MMGAVVCICCGSVLKNSFNLLHCGINMGLLVRCKCSLYSGRSDILGSVSVYFKMCLCVASIPAEYI